MMRFEGGAPIDSRQIIDTRIVQEAPFPEDPQARFEAIFAAIGNSEAKCVTLLSMEPHPMTSRDIQQRFIEHSDGIWKPNQTTHELYARQTFIPIGLVAEEDFVSYGSLNYTTGFKATPAGLHFGQPIAAFLLQKSSEMPHSLGELFAPTAATTGDRPIIRTVKILEFIYSRASDSPSDLEITKAIGGDSVSGQLARLSKTGLIEHKSVNTEKKGQVTYSLSGDARKKTIQAAARLPTLTYQIAQIFFDLGTADYLTITRELEKRFGKSVKRANVNSAISGLCAQGVLSSDFRGANKMSKSRIAPEGISLLESVIFPIREALTAEGGDLLEQWRKIDWRSYAKTGVQRYRENPTNSKRRPVQAWAFDAMGIILDNPGIRAVEIQTRLGRASSEPLRILLDQGLVKRETQGREARYYPVFSN